jgi:predicted adenylyl cyclase CyaB
MSRNIEIKARLHDRKSMEQIAASLAESGPTLLQQEDTFFACDSGRLKLRVIAEGHGELIYYRRADEEGPKESFYLLTPTKAPQNLKESLRLANGILGTVIKERTLYLIGRTRVHLDRVEGLGDFVELEVVLAENEAQAAGEQEADALMEQLGIAEQDLVRGAYFDLLAPA